MHIVTESVYYIGGNIFAIAEIGCAQLPKSLDKMLDYVQCYKYVLFGVVCKGKIAI